MPHSVTAMSHTTNSSAVIILRLWNSLAVWAHSPCVTTNALLFSQYNSTRMAVRQRRSRLLKVTVVTGCVCLLLIYIESTKTTLPSAPTIMESLRNLKSYFHGIGRAEHSSYYLSENNGGEETRKFLSTEGLSVVQNFSFVGKAMVHKIMDMFMTTKHPMRIFNSTANIQDKILSREYSALSTGSPPISSSKENKDKGSTKPGDNTYGHHKTFMNMNASKVSGSSAMSVGNTSKVSGNPIIAGGNANEVNGNSVTPGGNTNKITVNSLKSDDNASKVRGDSPLVGGNVGKVSGMSPTSSRNASKGSGNPYVPSSKGSKASGISLITGGNANNVSGNPLLSSGNSSIVRRNSHISSGISKKTSENSYISGGNTSKVSRDSIKPVRSKSQGGSVHQFSTLTFPYLMHPLGLCPAGVHLSYLVYVLSAPANIKTRQEVRQTWAAPDLLVEHHSRLMFIMGRPSDRRLLLQLKKESSVHRDIVMEDFVAAYDNLTYSSIAALRWVTYHCPNVSYVIKADDDVYVNIFKLIQTLYTQYINETRFFVCAAHYNVVIGRKSQGCIKNCLPNDILANKTHYPTYCAGPAYVFPRAVAVEIYNATRRVPPLKVEDVYITGILREDIKATIHSVQSGGSSLLLSGNVLDIIQQGRVFPDTFIVHDLQHRQGLKSRLLADNINNLPLGLRDMLSPQKISHLREYLKPWNLTLNIWNCYNGVIWSPVTR